MKRYLTLQEKQIATYQPRYRDDWKEPVEVFMNSQTLSNLPKTVRGIITKDGDLIVWDSLIRLHGDMIPRLVEDNFIEIPKNLTSDDYAGAGWLDWTLKSFLPVQELLSKQRGIFYVSESIQPSTVKNKQKIIIGYMEKAKKKNPDFEFVPERIG